MSPRRLLRNSSYDFTAQSSDVAGCNGGASVTRHPTASRFAGSARTINFNVSHGEQMDLGVQLYHGAEPSPSYPGRERIDDRDGDGHHARLAKFPQDHVAEDRKSSEHNPVRDAVAERI